MLLQVRERRDDTAQTWAVVAIVGVGTTAPHVAMPSSISGVKAVISADATAACSAAAQRRSGLANCARNHRTLNAWVLYARMPSPKNPETVRKCATRLRNLSTGAAQTRSSGPRPQCEPKVGPISCNDSPTETDRVCKKALDLEAASHFADGVLNFYRVGELGRHLPRGEIRPELVPFVLAEHGALDSLALEVEKDKVIICRSSARRRLRRFEGRPSEDAAGRWPGPSPDPPDAEPPTSPRFPCRSLAAQPAKLEHDLLHKRTLLLLRL